MVIDAITRPLGNCGLKRYPYLRAKCTIVVLYSLNHSLWTSQAWILIVSPPLWRVEKSFDHPYLLWPSARA